jgi:recombination protein RecR
MTRNSAGPEIEKLIALLARLPGLGPRSARRAVLHMLKKRDSLMSPLAEIMAQAAEKTGFCPKCGNIDALSPCAICSDPARDSSMIVVVEEVGDLWALERAGAIGCLYHVLGGVLSPLDGVGPDDLNISKLVERASEPQVREVLLALNATIDGQSTIHYLHDELAGCGVKISQLAHGVPVGGELDYLDEGTISAAIRARKQL